MALDHDATDFIDGDFESRPSPRSPAPPGPASRAPTREEVDLKVAEAQQRLAELKRAQEELERERTALEETRRRQLEFQTGRQELVQHLTRGIGLLQEAEFSARRDAEQMSKALTGLREALTRIEDIHEETWTQTNFNIELTRALTALENGRMEWNSARLKFTILSGSSAEAAPPVSAPGSPAAPILGTYTFGELCRLGFALSWPIAVVVLLGLAGILAVLLRR
jgi:hypothetical protein